MAVGEAEAIGAELGDRYAIVGVLGHGSSATVFLATAGETLGVERFQREILTVARLQHPNILPLFDSGTAAGRLWYTMPFVESGSLRDRLARDAQLSLEATIQLVREVAEALTYAHARGVIYRDIKPENIMLSETGHALLGRRADGVRAAERAAKLLSPSRDALAGPYVAAALAHTYMLAGMPEQATETLARLLDIPSGITRKALAADPLWGPLRGYPRFRALVEGGGS
jgi:serine/threonine protein kinase